MLFLDIDGVLNNDDTTEMICGRSGIDDALFSFLKQIIEHTGASVILSSSWKEGSPEHLDSLYAEEEKQFTEESVCYRYVIGKLKSVGIKISCIVDCDMNTRSEEISDYLRRHPEIKEFVVLDDESPSDMLKSQ